jgi:molecular chaperone HtpG
VLMEIPERLANKMSQDSALYGGVLQSLAEFKPWFDHSKTPFFPEYTDHNWSHVIQTMATASSLIRDEAWAVMTSSDAAILVLAVVLHDSGMHLTEDGFLALVGHGSDTAALEGWAEKTWPMLWSEFLGDASRFDARKLHAMFGDAEPVHPPASDSGRWTSRDRLLIGEFLRRHHARLAHEVAIRGVPGPGSLRIHLRGISNDLSEIAGLVARSHGLPIRARLPHLKDKFDVRDYRGVHAVFLMSALRVADYLQVQAERASEPILRVSRLRSPLSQREWKTHQAIRDIRNTHEDPEALYIDAAPKDVATFLHLKRLLAGIQEELDASWAVLGEVYGRFDGLEHLGIKLRRIRSNIDDEKEFAKTVPYLPCEAAFDSAGTDLLKLLIKPLYGERPEVGIRELIQNAVDACRELEDYLETHTEISTADLTGQVAEVVVSLENKNADGLWLEVSDRGIGMTPDVVRRYFLKAGASFRRSDAWRKLHETSEGKSRVMRSGRFGIGVLAAFLLGDEVEVSTRNVAFGAGGGLKFKASVDTEEIELVRCSRPVGTTIRVRIGEESLWKALAESPRNQWDSEKGRMTLTGTATWDWYCLATPKVVRLVRPTVSSENRLQQQFLLADAEEPLGPKWRRIKHPDYRDIQWSYWDGPFLACNGIAVVKESESGYRERILGRNGNLEIKWPRVSVFDPDGHLPLVLQRNELATREYPFRAELLQDVVRDWLAFALTLAPDEPSTSAISRYSGGLWYPGLSSGSRNGSFSGHFCSAAAGLYPAESSLIKQAGFHKLLLAGGLDLSKVLVPSLLSTKRIELVVPAYNSAGVQRFRQWIRFGLCGSYDANFGFLQDFGVACRRMLLPKGEYNLIGKGNLIAKELWSTVKEQQSNEKWVVLKTGDCNCGENLDLLELSDLVPLQGFDPILIEWHLAKSQSQPKELTPFAKLWGDLVKSPVVPYDLAERRKNFPRAFEELKSYVDAHAQLAADEEMERNKHDKKTPDLTGETEQV